MDSGKICQKQAGVQAATILYTERQFTLSYCRIISAVLSERFQQLFFRPARISWLARNKEDCRLISVLMAIPLASPFACAKVTNTTAMAITIQLAFNSLENRNKVTG